MLVVTLQNKPTLRCAMGRSQEKHNERLGFQFVDKVMQIPRGSGCTDRVGSRERKAQRWGPTPGPARNAETTAIRCWGQGGRSTRTHCGDKSKPCGGNAVPKFGVRLET